MKNLLSAAAAFALVGCAAVQPPPVRPGPFDDAPAMGRSPAPIARGTAGGVFAPDSGVSLYSDSRAFRVGDVVTVMLEETTQASKSAGTSFSKDSGVAISAPGLLGKTFAKAAIDLNGGRTFEGDATSTQQNALAGAITVVVQEVMPNGLLRLAGEKLLTLNQGEEFVRLRGYVRAADIDADNKVSSLRIANARIAYSGTGALADASSPGWLTRFFTSALMPF